MYMTLTTSFGMSDGLERVTCSQSSLVLDHCSCQQNGKRLGPPSTIKISSQDLLDCSDDEMLTAFLERKPDFS